MIGRNPLTRNRTGSLAFAGLLALAACSPTETSRPREVPAPFDQLPGIAVGITTDSLLEVRPDAREDEIWDLHDSLPPYTLLYRQDLGLLQSLGLKANRIVLIFATRPLWPDDTASGGLRRLLRPAPTDSIRCLTRGTLTGSVMWAGRRVGDHEFVAAVQPEHEIRHRNGVDTAAAQTTIVWRKWQAEPEGEMPTTCPGDPDPRGNV